MLLERFRTGGPRGHFVLADLHEKMRFRVLSNGVAIGATNLESLDPSMGVASGVFTPSESYGAVQPTFRLYATAGISVADQDQAKLKAYYAARDALNLSLVTQEGETVPTSCIHITDYSVTSRSDSGRSGPWER